MSKSKNRLGLILSDGVVKLPYPRQNAVQSKSDGLEVDDET